MTREELESQPWRGRGGSSKVYRGVLAMEIGGIIWIDNEDWGKRKYSPTRVVRYIEKKYNRKYTVLRHAAQTGWAVERLG